ncbi:MAG: SDR family oxidoreductase [Planctomycetia bacterium]|nr:SDR family oxidoreductase [Planctomycetia bacterium]MCC7315816.1 SDR family oxidoreductase [Planctomycetota bacterium]
MLRGQTAVVTGAGRGIGRAIARRLAAAGAHVAITSRTAEQLHETQKCIERDNGRVLSIVADVTREEDVERLFAETAEVLGPVKILINNAGISPVAKIEEMEPHLFDTLVCTNIRSVFLCTRAVWDGMVKSGGGSIVNISSVSAYDPFPGLAAYGGAKAFVTTYSKGLAEEGRPRGIRVYCVAPGAVETDMLRGAFPEFPEDQVLQPEDVASLVELLLMPGARYSSGQSITIRKS